MFTFKVISLGFWQSVFYRSDSFSKKLHSCRKVKTNRYNWQQQKVYLQFKIPPSFKFRQKTNKKTRKRFCWFISKWQFSKQVYTSFWMRHFLLMFLALNPINDFELQTYFLTLKFAALKVVLKKKEFYF
jgi:hypothetical protein